MIALRTRWPALRRRLAAAEALVLLLDYDGTLVPIAAHPSLARLPAAVRRVLDRLSRRPGVQILVISGRAVRDVRRRVGLRRVWYAGNHGWELEGPGLRYRHPAARAARPALRQAAWRLAAALADVPGAWVEDKRCTLSIHYRAVPVGERDRVLRACRTALRPFRARRQLRVTRGKSVVEVHPPVRWTKGSAVRWWLKRQRLERRADVWYLGDDRTDEDAFAALRGRGVTILVARVPRLSRARYRVAGPADVLRLLRRIAEARHG